MVPKSDSASCPSVPTSFSRLVYASPASLPVFAMSPTAPATFVSVAARSKKPVWLTSLMIASASVENPSPALTAPSPMESMTPLRESRTFAKDSLIEETQVPTASTTVPMAVPMDSIRDPTALIGSESDVFSVAKDSTIEAMLPPTLVTTSANAVPILAIASPTESMIGLTCESSSEKLPTIFVMLSPTLVTILTTAVPIFSITVPMESMIGPMDVRTSLKALMMSGSFETVVSTIFVMSGI